MQQTVTGEFLQIFSSLDHVFEKEVVLNLKPNDLGCSRKDSKLLSRFLILRYRTDN